MVKPVTGNEDAKPPTCGECQFALWVRTPSGRIKKNVAGRCGKARELEEFYKGRQVAPCISISAPSLVCIWPDYDATNCPLRA